MQENPRSDAGRYDERLWYAKETSVLDLAIMVEGQCGINWTRWRRPVRAVEDLGFTGLYRSDHFTNPTGPYLDALELWTSLTWLADT